MRGNVASINADANKHHRPGGQRPLGLTVRFFPAKSSSWPRWTFGQNGHDGGVPTVIQFLGWRRYRDCFEEALRGRECQALRTNWP
jgi:hypothetical protein